MRVHEVNFDGLIGPTHNYAGLAIGNLAAQSNAGLASNPRAAALQGLAKMKAMVGLGLHQGFIPPQERPRLDILRQLGFSGRDQDVIGAVGRDAPDLLANCYSASSMWAANAATVTPSSDAADGKVHFTPANLATNFHRSIEVDETATILRHVFCAGSDAADSPFVHQSALPGGLHFGDEGAANHGRLCWSHSDAGLHLFVYGEDGTKFPARQTLAASEAIARAHGIATDRRVFLKQSKRALDAGAFHNDVVGVANESVLFLHAESFEEQDDVLEAVRQAAPFVTIIEAPATEVALSDAVSSYLFNSQLVTLPATEGEDRRMVLILPNETQENEATRRFVEKTIAEDNPVSAAHYFDVRESMRNGGGPACLRLRVALNDSELAEVNSSFLLSTDHSMPNVFGVLEDWVNKHYRDRLHPDDLRDPAFADEVYGALDALTDLLNMGSFYSFQKSNG